MNRFVLAAAIQTVLNERASIDPESKVPIYDLHAVDGRPTGFCLVRTEVLDEIWRRVNGSAPVPHSHIDPTRNA